MSDRTFGVELTRGEGYRFHATPDREGAPTFLVDEAPPLGEGSGATPTELLAAAVGGCLSASLVFCMEKARVPVEGVRTRVKGILERNEAGRLRVEGLQVTLEVDLPEESRGRGERCLGLFQDFCIVKESVRAGIPIDVEVVDGTPAVAAGEPAPASSG